MFGITARLLMPATMLMPTAAGTILATNGRFLRLMQWSERVKSAWRHQLRRDGIFLILFLRME